MAQHQETLTSSCPAPRCKQQIQIAKNWTPGGMNDYGGFVLRCNSCGTISSIHVGRDVNDSEITSGAAILDRYDDEVGNKAVVLQRHGIKSE